MKKSVDHVCVCYNPTKGGLFYSVRAYTCLVQEPSSYVVPELKHEGRYKLRLITGYLKEQGTLIHGISVTCDSCTTCTTTLEISLA